MKISRPIALIGTFVLASVLSPNRAWADMASGEVLANTCFSCHGTDGNSLGDMPTIHGKSEQFIIKKLRAHKSGSGSGASSTVMSRIAKGFSDDEIAALAKFFASRN